jgi:hypothetical protein
MARIQLSEAAEAVDERVRVTVTCISEMRGAYPEIGLPEDIDRAALGADAFFVTLPIGQVGAKSRNQRRYSRAAVEQMVAQINAQRPEGMWGHIAADETATRYDPPAIRWLAAVIDGEGVAWGKGLPLTAETRDYYRLAKATNARVGTSLVAWAQMDGEEVQALELVTVDLADPARVGVPVTAAKALISTEMDEGKGKESTQRRREGQSKAQSGEEDAAELVALRELFGEGDVVAQVRALMAEREALLDAAITAAVERAVRIPAALGLVEQLVRGKKPQTQAAIGDAVAAVVTSEAVQGLLREMVAQTSGPALRRMGRREEESGFFSF